MFKQLIALLSLFCFQNAFSSELTPSPQKEQPPISFTTVGLSFTDENFFPISYFSLENASNWQLSSIKALENVNLTRVFCHSTGCIAVGDYDNGMQNVPISFVSQDQGKNWSVSSSLPSIQSQEDHSLASVSCNDAGVCVAVGNYQEKWEDLPLAYISYDGGNNWMLSNSLPLLPNGESYEMTSVSCNTHNKCVAVGSYYHSLLKKTKPLVYVSSDHGNNWLPAIQPPSLEAHEGQLMSVSCDNEGSCVSVGAYEKHQEQQGLLSYISADQGNTWTHSQTLPTMTSNDSVQLLTSVSCNLEGICTAIGNKGKDEEFLQPFSYISFDKGNNWVSSNPFKTPEKSTTAALLDVSCSKDNVCVAVGAHGDLTEKTVYPLLYTSFDNGMNWELSSIPAAYGILSSVSHQ